MDAINLKQKKEAKAAPYSLVLITIIAGGFFLLGVGVSALTLNAVQASNQSSRGELNIAKLAESQNFALGLSTDIYTYQEDWLVGQVSYEYPGLWEKSELGKKNLWDSEYKNELQQINFKLSVEEGNTHIKTAISFSESLGNTSGELELIESGETASEKLVFGIYSYKVEDEIHRIAVIDASEDKEENIARLIIDTTAPLQTLLNLTNRVNLTT